MIPSSAADLCALFGTILILYELYKLFLMFVAEPGSSVAEEIPSDAEDVEIPKWKGKEKAIYIRIGHGDEEEEVVDDETSIDAINRSIMSRGTQKQTEILEVDWTKYEPPEGLTSLLSINSDTIATLVQESITQIKTRIAEEERKRVAAEEAERLRMEEAARAESEKEEDAANTTGDVPGTSTVAELNAKEPLAKTQNLTEISMSAPYPLPVVPAPPRKSKKRWLAKLLHRSNYSEKTARRQKSRSSLSVESIKKVNSESPGSSVHELTVECVSCLDDVPLKDTVKGPCHHYCVECFVRLVTTACENEQQWPPKCCLNQIPSQTILSHISSELSQKYRERSEEWDTPIADRVYCGRRGCSQWIRPTWIDRSTNIARCSRGHQTCLICRGTQHEGNNCPQDQDLMRTEELAEEEGWKRCYKCHAFVEHREACQHMTCRCGGEFCYVCGSRWRTCSCSMEQLDSLKSQARARRQARLDQEVIEAAEAAEAVRQVEEFMREETRKAEILRAERERREAERRRQELEAWIERERARRVEVDAKFRKLSDMLIGLHEWQRWVIGRGHETDDAMLLRQARADMKELTEKQDFQKEAILQQSHAKLMERESTLDNEYIARLAEERRIETDYHEQLKAYWGKNGAHYAQCRIETAMTEFRHKMDAQFSAWKKWMKNELENYEYQLQEDREIQMELMEEARRRLSESAAQRYEDFSRRKQAELKWVDEVIEIRNAMLADMELDEAENGGEDIVAWLAEGGLAPDEFGVELIPEASSSRFR